MFFPEVFSTLPELKRGGTNSISTSGKGESIISKFSSIVTAILVFSPSSLDRTSLTMLRRRVSNTSLAKAFGAATRKLVAPLPFNKPNGFVRDKKALC
ncbi:unannotated protein [freshwater metagenome]|uniref:Unannotated protein n=1 Tax=freshwater metagenome TaxID=449393 RepID=A0A6J7LL33_9ZZZZ